MGDDNSPAGCLAAAKKMSATGINFAIYPGNNVGFACTSTIPLEDLKLTPL